MERPQDRGRGGAGRLAGVHHHHQHRQAQHVGEQDELLALVVRDLAGGGQELDRRHPLLAGQLDLLGEGVQVLDGGGHQLGHARRMAGRPPLDGDVGDAVLGHEGHGPPRGLVARLLSPTVAQDARPGHWPGAASSAARIAAPCWSTSGAARLVVSSPAVEIQRRAHGSLGALDAVLDGDDHAQMLGLRIDRRLGDRVDRREGQVEGLHPHQPVGAGAGGEDGVQRLEQRRIVVDPPLAHGEARVGGQGLAVDGQNQVVPELLDRRQVQADQLAVGAAHDEGLGQPRPVERRRHLAQGEIAGEGLDGEMHHRLQHRDLDQPPLAGAAALDQGGHDPQRRIEAGDGVGHGGAEQARRVGVGRDAEEARQGLGDGVVARPLDIGAAGAEAEIEP